MRTRRPATSPTPCGRSTCSRPPRSCGSPRRTATRRRSTGSWTCRPTSRPTVVLQTQEVVGDRTNRYDQALAIQDWLRDTDNFTYSEDVADTVGDANGSQAIAAFLQTRQGYCVHFASTMAVMARILDIPARVAVGLHRRHRRRAGQPQRRPEGRPRLARALLRGRRLGGLRADTRRAAPATRRRGRAAAPARPTPGSTPSSSATAHPAPAATRRTACATVSAPTSPASTTAVRRRGGGIGAGPVRVPVIPLVDRLSACCSCCSSRR